MRSNLFKALAVAVVSASWFGIISTAALAEKSGGILKFYHRGTPPSGSIHEEATSSTLVPYMSVFNNLVMLALFLFYHNYFGVHINIYLAKFQYLNSHF